MTFQFQPEIPVFVGILLLTASLAIYASLQYHRRGRKPELIAFIFLLIVISIWQINAIFLNSVTDPALKLSVRNFGNAVLVPSFVYSLVWFSLAYSENTRWVNRWTGGFALATIGAISTTVFVSPEFLYEANGLTTQGPITILGVTVSEWVVLDLTLKPAFRVYQLYSYAMMLLSAGILARYLLRNRAQVYHGQAVALVTGIGAPLGVNSLLFAGVLPPEVNLTHVSFGVTAVAFAVAVFRYRLFAVAPVGRKQVVEQLSDPVIMLDDKRRVVDCNPAARQLVDAPAGWRGMAAADFFAPFAEPAGWFSTPEPSEITLSKDSERQFEVESMPIQNRHNNTSGQLVLLHEVTQQKARQRKLQEQNESLDQFVSIVSHDLQNPLNVAKGRLAMEQREYDSDQLAEVDTALTRMESLIDDLLTIARTTQTIGETEPVAFNEAAREAWMYSDVRDCELDLSLPTSVQLTADRDRLLAVFENLYVNAEDHNDGPVTIRVGLLDDDTQPSEGRRTTGFYIEDDGKGIPAEEQSKIFEKGYTNAVEGTGLGLMIVRDIVTAHGWDIDVTESSDGGARFEITGVALTQPDTNQQQ